MNQYLRFGVVALLAVLMANRISYVQSITGRAT